MSHTQHMVNGSAPPAFVPDRETARAVLSFLAGLQPAGGQYEADLLAGWLAANELGSLAQAAYRESCPELAARLQSEVFTNAAQNALHWRDLHKIDLQLDHINVPAVLLKGAALAGTVYPSPEQRSMTDVDLWFRGQDMGQACHVMVEQGFTNFAKTERPLALQALSDGEIQYFSGDQPPTLVELHLSPFQGWWLQRTAVIDKEGLWSRIEAVEGWHSFFQLAAEDAVIHTAVHLAVNHQFGRASLRGLMDIALTARVRGVDWHIVGDRAEAWRVATAVWLVLHCLQALTGTPGLDGVLEQLQPSPWRRRQLQRYVSPESVLAGQDMRSEQQRYLFLLLLVDRPQDAARLMYRTVWPEDAWLDARYGGDVDRWQHIQRVVIQRDV